MRDYPEGDPKLELLPSGAVTMNLMVGATEYAIQYLPSFGGCVGIANVDKAVFGWEGYDHPFDDFDGARDFLLSLLDAAYGAPEIEDDGGPEKAK